MEDVEKKIIKLLEKHKNGLTVEDLSKEIDTSRITIANRLAGLVGKNRISIRRVGPAKLHYLKD